MPKSLIKFVLIAMKNIMTRQDIVQMEAGPDLDNLIAESLEYMKVYWGSADDAWGWADRDKKITWPINQWHPSTNILVSLEIANKIFDKGYWLTMSCGPLMKSVNVEFSRIEDGQNVTFAPYITWFSSDAFTIPLAICRAALLVINEIH